MQSIFNMFSTSPSSNPASGSYDQKTHQWLDNVLTSLSKDRIHPQFIRHIQNRITALKVPGEHPVAKKIQGIQSRYPHLKHLSTTVKSENVPPQAIVTQTSKYELLSKLPIINGDVLNVNCTLAAIKLIIKLEGERFKEIVLHDVDDVVLDLIAKNCPSLESLIIRVGYTPSMGFTDKGLESIAKLEKLKKLEIVAWLSIDLSSEGFEKLLKTQALQTGLQELTIHQDNFDDKGLGAIAGYKSLKSLDLANWGMTTQGLLTLFSSASLKATLEKISIKSFENARKVSFNDALVSALSSFTLLQEISLDTQWQITDPIVIKFLEAHKNIASLKLRGLPLSAPVAATIGEMGALTSLESNNCSNLWSEEIGTLLNNKALITQMNLGNARELTGKALEQLSGLPKLTALYINGSSMAWGDLDSLCKGPEMQKHLHELYLTNLRYANAESLINVGKLKALTVLRIDKCPQFNDDAFKGIFETSLKNQLTTVQLKDVAITQNSFKYLNDAASLKTLLLANCFAITKEGWAQFFDLANLQKNLTMLLLDRFASPDSMADKFDKFLNLKRLAIINQPLDVTEIYKLYDRQTNSGGQFDFIYWMGPDDDGVLYRFLKGESF